MHGFSAAVCVTSALLLLPACRGQLFTGLRLQNPLSSLFGQRGGDPDSDVTEGRTELENDPLPDMIPRTNNPPAVIYRSAPSMVIESSHLGDPGHLYFSRPMPYVLGQRAHLDRLPPFGPPAVVAPPVQPLAGAVDGRRPQRPGRDDEPEDRRAVSRSESVSKDLDAPSAEDRIIEALRLFKQLRNMAV